MADGCEFIERAALAEPDREKICFRNAERVFGLEAAGSVGAHAGAR